MTVGRGGKCWKAEGGKWKQAKSGTKCTSWVKAVDWKTSDSRKGARTYVSKYDKKDNHNFGGGDSYLGSGVTTVKNADECSRRCDGESNCTGFVIGKKRDAQDKYTCWVVGSGRTGAGHVPSNDWMAYTKRGAGGGDCSGKDSVVAYENGSYGGSNATTLKCGQTYEGETLPFWNKVNDVLVSKTSSMKIPKGMKVYIESAEGKSHTYIGDQENVGGEWNDKIKKFVPQACTQEDYDKNGCVKP
jgi:hypothetical protein